MSDLFVSLFDCYFYFGFGEFFVVECIWLILRSGGGMDGFFRMGGYMCMKSL